MNNKKLSDEQVKDVSGGASPSLPAKTITETNNGVCKKTQDREQGANTCIGKTHFGT